MSSKHFWILPNGKIEDVSKLTYTHVEYAAKYFEVEYEKAYDKAFKEGWLRLSSENGGYNISFHKKSISKTAILKCINMLKREEKDVDEIFLELLDTKQDKQYKIFKNKSDFLVALEDLENIANKKFSKVKFRRSGEMRISDFL